MMRPASHLPDEDARLAALANYSLGGDQLVDLQDVVRLAASIFEAPIAFVSIIERHRLIFKASVGVDLCEIDRDRSFCAHALHLPPDAMLVVPDAREDPRFAGSEHVTGDPHIRFYAGVPLRSPDGHAIGTLCVIDSRPRPPFSDEQQGLLRAMASIILDRLEMRRLDAARAAGQSRFENIAATSPDGIICADDRGRITFWNKAAERLFGFATADALGAGIDIIVPERMRGGHAGGLDRVAGGATPRLVGTTVELTATHQSGAEFPIELSLSMWRQDGRPSFGAIIRNITERRCHEQRLHRLAHLDALTDLPNRAALMTHLADRVAAGDPTAVMVVDLDRFKDVNDTLGHSTGDEVLRLIATRIVAGARAGDVVARLGGDEFAILLPHPPEDEAIAAFAEAIIATVAEPVLFDDEFVQLSTSIGVALFPDHGADAEALLSAADLAMYQAKAEGRDCWRFFSPFLRETALNRRAFTSEVRRAIEEDEFELFYQPQARLADGAIVGMEALLRWRHPVRGLLTPDRFLSSIESSLLAPAVGRWVLDRACADAAALRLIWPDLVMGINLFGAQFRSADFAGEIEAALEAADLPPHALELEITENIILRHDDTMLKPLRHLRAQGIRIAFDDFGTGFASLSMLKRYPITRLKIDRGFVRDMCADKADAAIVAAMVQLGASLDVEVVAEGVETEEQREFLVACGCLVVQGYLYGRPAPLAETGALAIAPPVPVAPMRALGQPALPLASLA